MCDGCSLTRREFLGSAALAGGVLLAGNLAAGSARAAATQPEWPKLAPAKIYKIFCGRTGGSYLSQPTEELQKLDAYLAEMEKRIDGLQFVGGDMIPPSKLEELAEKAKDADGLFLVHLSGHGGDAPTLGKLIDLDKPTVLFSQPFSGHGWIYFNQWQKAGKKITMLPTSDWSELDASLRLMRVPAWLRQSRLIVVGTPKGTPAIKSAEEIKKRLGVEMVVIDNQQILDAIQAIDPQAAEAEAEAYWLSQAKKIVEPKREEVIESARMFLAVRDLMIRERAQAITSSHCMGNPRGCLTFSKLNDLGKVGACEGDVDSALTMMIFAYAFGVPGFITDPVIDTARNALIHFHCTSTTKLDGPAGERQPFTIRNQTDTGGGVALEVDNRIGQAVTCAKLVNLDTMLLSTGKITEVTHSPLACRTQFTTQVKDARKMFLDWGGGAIDKFDTMTVLHRVVFYGDHQREMDTLASLMGLKVREEGA